MSNLRKLKKQRRTQLQILTQDNIDIEFLDQPSLFVCIANGGVAMGISRDLLWHVLSPYNVVKIVTPSGKQYAFAAFSSLSHAQRLVSTINGCSIQALCQNKSLLMNHLSNGPPITTYLSYISAIPHLFVSEQLKVKISAPSGLILIPDFISNAEETLLLNFFDFGGDKNNAGNSGLLSNVTSPKMELKQRKVMHYGYEFDYVTNNVDPTKPLPGGLPEVCTPIVDRMVQNNLIANKPDQLTVNRYLAGQGIPPHVDTHSAFQDEIVSITMGSHTVMDFRDQYSEEKVSVLLPKRSVLVMGGESRLKWMHGIAGRKFDIIHNGSLLTDQFDKESLINEAEKFIIMDCNDSTVVERGVRISLTLRKIRCLPCTCGFSLSCNSAT